MNEDEDRPSEQELGDLQEGQDTVVDADEVSHESDEGATQDDPAKLQKRLKDTQKAYHEAARERAELKKVVEKLQTQVETVISMGSQKQADEPPDNPFAFLDEETLQEKLLEDPKNVTQVIKQVISRMAQVMEVRDRALLGEMERRDPSVAQMRDKINKLREDPDYSEFSDRQLVILAKKQLTKKAEKKEEDDPYPGPMGGGRRVSTSQGSENDPMEREIAQWEKRLGYDKEHGFGN